MVETRVKDTFLEVSWTDRLEKVEVDIESKTDYDDYSEFSVKVSRPFLNAIQKYKEERISIYFFSNHPLTFHPIAGGEGWYYRYSALNPIDTFTSSQYKISILSISSLFFLSLYLFITYLNQPDSSIFIELIIFLLLLATGFIALNSTFYLGEKLGIVTNGKLLKSKLIEFIKHLLNS